MQQATLDKFIQLKADEVRTVYFVEIEGLEFLFRPLKFDEYKFVNELDRFLDGANVNDTLLRLAVFHSSHDGGLEGWLNRGKAGHPDFLAQTILDLSGFQNPEAFVKLVNEKRAEAAQVHSVIETYICSAFHSIRPEEVANMTLEEQLCLFAKAEQALGNPVNFEEIFGLDKNEEEVRPNVDPRSMPIPPGYETTAPEIGNILSSEAADLPEWGKANKGE
jgi:hypothetical protein